MAVPRGAGRRIEAALTQRRATLAGVFQSGMLFEIPAEAVASPA